MNAFSSPVRSPARFAASAAGFTLVDTTLLLASLAVVVAVSVDRISHSRETAPAHSRSAHATGAIAGTIPVANSSASTGAITPPTAGQVATRDSWFGAHRELAPEECAALAHSPDCHAEDLAAISEQLGIADLDSGEGLVANVSGAVQSWMDRIDAVLAVQRELSAIPSISPAGAR